MKNIVILSLFVEQNVLQPTLFLDPTQIFTPTENQNKGNTHPDSPTFSYSDTVTVTAQRRVNVSSNALPSSSFPHESELTKVAANGQKG